MVSDADDDGRRLRGCLLECDDLWLLSARSSSGETWEDCLGDLAPVWGLEIAVLVQPMCCDIDIYRRG